MIVIKYVRLVLYRKVKLKCKFIDACINTITRGASEERPGIGGYTGSSKRKIIKTMGQRHYGNGIPINNVMFKMLQTFYDF